MKPTRLKQGEFIGLWLALVIIAAVAALAYRSISAAADTLGWVEHTHLVLQQVEDVSSTYARAVSARRAYVVGGDASQLGDTVDLDARMERALDVAHASMADNASQIRHIEALGVMQRQRVASLDKAVAQRRREGSSVETSDGIVIATKIRTEREGIEAEENRLLAERDARTRRDMSRTMMTVVGGTLVSFAILLFAFGRLRQEIAWRERSEQGLRASERFLDSIIENIPDMVFVKGAGELRFERLNRAGEELLGVNRKDLLQRNDFDLFPKEQAEFFVSRDRAALANREVVDIPEEPIQTKDGERWLHTKKVPIFDDSGAPKYLLGISEDISERRKAAAALKAAKEAADAANKELEAFSYSVAHDLRAPLRAIDGFSSALEEECAPKLSDQDKAHLTRVRAAAQHMAQLIDGLLGLSRLTRSELVREKLDLTRIAKEAGARLREAFPAQKVELFIQDNLAAEGDSRLLGAVFDNFLGNAWKFSSKTANPRVEVGSKVEGGETVFFIRDNGVGFEQAFAHKLFGAFQRLHGATEFEGTGIGLATVQRIIRRHGGRVWAEGEVGHGAAFYFTL